MGVNATRWRLRIARGLLAMLPVLAVAGCAKEPPPEEEYRSLKDQWTDRTTVSRAEDPAPVKVVYTPPPPTTVVVEPLSRPRPAPLRSVRVPLERARPPAAAPSPAPPTGPATKETRPTRSEPPSLAISPPKVETPPPAATPAAPTPPARPEALTEADLANCGKGAECLAVLRAMIADPTQSWMVRAPTPEEFANGTRLFAYRVLRPTLECGKLRFASAELDWAIDTFHGTPAGVDATHRARVAALAEAVRSEIEAEIRKRC